MNFIESIFAEPYMLQAFGAVTLTALAIVKMVGGISIFGTVVYLLKGPKAKFSTDSSSR